MYAKIEAERALYILLNQKPLRFEQYVHLKDALVSNNIGEVGQLVILYTVHYPPKGQRGAASKPPKLE